MNTWVISFRFYEYATNIHHEFLCGHYVFTFIGNIAKSQTVGSNIKYFSKWMHNLNDHQECVRVPIFYIPDSIYYCLFNYNHPSEYEVVPLCAFGLYFIDG